MYRVEAKNHDEKFEAFSFFDDDQKDLVKKFLAENDNYFLKVFHCGDTRKLVFKNF